MSIATVARTVQAKLSAIPVKDPTTVFANILNKIDEYVKIAPWLQFVGYMVMVGAFVAHYTEQGFLYKHAPMAGFVGFGVSMAGFVYDKIYP